MIFSSCFIGRVEVLAGALLAPVLAVILFNVVIFVIVLTVLIKHSKKKIERAKASSDGSSREATIRLLISIFSIMNLYGLTWLFAIFTFTEGSLAFQILFAIFNSLQGFFMFIFFCVLGKEARESWARVLCRGKLKKFAPNTSTSRPGVHNTSSAQPNNGRRYSAQTTGTQLRSSTATNSPGRRSSFGIDTLRSLSSPRPSISEEPSSVSINEDHSSSGPDLIEINSSAIAMDTLERSRLTKIVTPMLTLDEADEEEEDGVIHPSGNLGIVEMLEPPFTGGDSASVSGASLAESGIMIDDEIIYSSPNDLSSPQPSEHQEVGAGYIMHMERPQPTNESDQESEDESEVLQNPHAEWTDH